MDATLLERTEDLNEAVLPFALLLELRVTDPELVQELTAYQDGRPREEYGLCALKIGLLALKEARGQVDGETIRREGDKLLAALETKLTLHARGLDDQLTGALKGYFDPESGRFQERLQRLLKKDGELEEVLRRQVGQQDSELCKTLTGHFGKDSPLMKVLNPKESDGLLKALQDTLDSALADQRKRVLDEFSLDNQEGALSRLVGKLAASHGDLNKDLQTKLNDVVKEFSLDNEESALSRLVRRVTEAQRVISAEFSLDNDQSALSRMSKHLQNTSEAIDNHLTLDKETSALARLKRELLEILTKNSESNQKFQQEVTCALNEMKVRKQEAQRTPVHGKEFEQKVHDYIQGDCQRAGEVASFTGDTVGAIKNCKAGDTLVEIGPEHIAAGARVVVEAKDKKGYTFQQAREEIEQARKNRSACVGLFVFAKSTAPEGLAPFQRIGEDLFVVWDADDAHTDIHLQAGLTVARALCTRQAKQRDASAADFVSIDKAINDIEKKAESLDAIRKAAETIQSGADTILNRVRIAKDEILKQVVSLRDLMAELKTTLEPSV